MYKIYWTNFGYYADLLFDDVKTAICYGKSKGFEFTVFLGTVPVAFTSGVNQSTTVIGE